MTARINEKRELATEAGEELNVAQADVALPLALWESARERKDTEATLVTPLRTQLAAKNAKLFQLSAKRA